MTLAKVDKELVRRIKADSRLITKVEVIEESFPLHKPYELSFIRLEEFLSLSVRIHLSDGSERTAEVVPLFGYVDEKPDQIKEYLLQKAEECKGLALSSAREKVARDIANTPFSTTALLTAIDLFHFELHSQFDLPDFCIPTSAGGMGDLKESLKSFKKKECIKLKLSGDPSKDKQTLDLFKSLLASNEHQLRLDVNQAYSLDEARDFFSLLDSSSVLSRVAYVEQPLNQNDWDGHQTLRKEFTTIPIMLDESIVTEKDLHRAKGIDVSIVKLKLFKQGGIHELLHLTNVARSLEMQIVLGNGVATKISNEVEIEVFNRFSSSYQAPLESNGFLKCGITNN